MPELVLLVGLPAAGKTTLARELAAATGALRLTPDEWMGPLFGSPDPDDRRRVLEGRFVWTAAQALAAGTDVILDFGFWSRDERAALHWLARSVGAHARTVHLDVDAATQHDRMAARHPDPARGSWTVPDADLDAWRDLLEPPATDELDGTWQPEVPAGWSDWPSWIEHAWPSAGVGDQAVAGP